MSTSVLLTGGNLIFREDDCAPDAIQHLSEQMKDRLCMTLEGFIACGNRRSTADCTQWVLGSFYLERSADDPFYKLYKMDANK